MSVSYLANYVKDYSLELDNCENLISLKDCCKKWYQFAADAYDIVNLMTDDDFIEFQRGMKLERKNRKYGAGKKWQQKYASILMPTILFCVGMFSIKFLVPWGTAFNRLEEERFIAHNGDHYVWIGQKIK